MENSVNALNSGIFVGKLIFVGEAIRPVMVARQIRVLKEFDDDTLLVYDVDTNKTGRINITQLSDVDFIPDKTIKKTSSNGTAKRGAKKIQTSK